MKRDVAVLDVLFPNVRARVLPLLFSPPPKQRYVRELMNLSGLALCTVQDELRKLSAVGLVTSWSNGYHRYYQANQRHPLFADLGRIVEMSERLPAAKHAALHRKRSSPVRNKRRRPRPLPLDRPIKWNLFSPRPHRSRRS
jgi:predicted transcriptional regulator